MAPTCTASEGRRPEATLVAVTVRDFSLNLVRLGDENQGAA